MTPSTPAPETVERIGRSKGVSRDVVRVVIEALSNDDIRQLARDRGIGLKEEDSRPHPLDLVVERHDQDDGSISYEIWKADFSECVATLNDSIYPKAKKYAERFARSQPLPPASEIIGTITVCAGPPTCLLEDDAAFENAKAGCPQCRRIHVHTDGTETEDQVHAD